MDSGTSPPDQPVTPRMALLAALLLMLVVVILDQRRDNLMLRRQSATLARASTALVDLLTQLPTGAASGSPGDVDLTTLQRRLAEELPPLAAGDSGLEGVLWSLVGRTHERLASGCPRRLELALDAYERGLALQTLAYGDDDARTLGASIELGRFLERHGHLDEAESLLSDAADPAAAVFAPDDERLLGAQLSRGRLAALRGTPRPASTLLTAVARLARSRLGESHPFVIQADLLLLEHCHHAAQLELSLEVLARRLQDGHFDRSTLRALMDLSAGLLQSGRAEDKTRALTLRRQLLAARDDRFGADDPDGPLAWNRFASELPPGRETRNEGECILRRSLGVFERRLGPRAPRTLQTLQQLAQTLAAGVRSSSGTPPRQAIRRREAERRAEALGLERLLLARADDSLCATSALRSAATLGLCRLLLEDGRSVEAEGLLLALDAERDRLRSSRFADGSAGSTELAELLARVFRDRGQESLAAAILSVSPAP